MIITIFIIVPFTLIAIVIIFVLMVIGIGIRMPCIMPYMVWSVGGIMLDSPPPPLSLAINEHRGIFIVISRINIIGLFYVRRITSVTLSSITTHVVKGVVVDGGGYCMPVVPTPWLCTP